jgi:hypothetical protein
MFNNCFRFCQHKQQHSGYHTQATEINLKDGGNDDAWDPPLSISLQPPLVYVNKLNADAHALRPQEEDPINRKNKCTSGSFTAVLPSHPPCSTQINSVHMVLVQVII